MLIIKKKYEIKENEYEIKENVAYLTLTKKDGSIIHTKIDSEDLQRVISKGAWFPQWDKNFNNYLAQNISNCNVDGKNKHEKQTLHSFILGTHPKIQIRHCNGDTLDNRKCNLEVYNENDGINEYKESDTETIEILLKDKYCKEKSKTLIDKEDLDKVLHSGYTWVLLKTNKLSYAVANSPEGRIYLDSFIMDTPKDKITQHINLNTLDNRKCNLKKPSISEE
ncbi:hypothetical protein OW763_05815 [Clostridium aestuarii]|uniref:HNH nuclease domain-containing protein n=1 Tax=Clostridium aestuarii TaxID=338193 RepID=A0ABT4D115_9CLOT|nr:hypothetical protein [Clostridium aestuarii]MCY6483865.1 hypothetical protein [Clostridium aestuarii]